MADRYSVNNAAERIHGYLSRRPHEQLMAAFKRAVTEAAASLASTLIAVNELTLDGYLAERKAGRLRGVEGGNTSPDVLEEAVKVEVAPDLEVMRVLVCSTAHVTAEEALKIDADELVVVIEDDFVRLIPLKWPHGWIFYLGGADNALNVPVLSDGFNGAVTCARENGLEWIRFDGDGPTLPGVPTYSW